MREILRSLGIEDVNAGGFGGAWTGSGKAQTVVSPINGEALATVTNVTPAEFDGILARSHEAFQTWKLVPAPKRGEVVKAFVVPKAGQTLAKAEVIAFCRQKLAGYKVPRHVEFRESLPKTIVGKVLRRALRAEENERTKACGVPHVVDDTSSEG